MVNIELGAVVMIGLLVPADRSFKDGPGWVIRTRVLCASRGSEISKLIGRVTAVIPLIGNDAAEVKGAIGGFLVEGRNGFPSGILGFSKESVIESIDVRLSGDAFIASDLHRNDEKLDVAI